MLAVLMLNVMATKRRKAMKKPTKPGKLETKSPEDYCRTCLSTSDLVSMFYNKQSEEKRSSELKLVTGLDIRMNDGLSQKICSNCILTINSALQFRRTSKKAEKALLNMITGTNKKKPKLKDAKPKVEKHDTEEYNYEYTLFGEEFQNDYDYAEPVEEKAVIKEKPVGRKRSIIPNASSYKCPTCSKEFRMKATYKAHMRFHTNYCVCEACGKRCRNNNQLQEHKRARHGLGRIHKCAYCEYSSATKEALTIHERRHTGERPYICDHCGATFHRRSNLVQHIAIHLPEKNFQCSMCPKREKSRKLLTIHEYKYHREKRYRYICPVCQDSFTRPGNVRQHLARSHAISREDQGVIEKIEINLPAASETRLEYTVTDNYI